MRTLTLVTLCGLAASTALGQTWTEQGDAGDLPASSQECSGSGPLTRISGNHGADDGDMYKIRIATPGAFRASTAGNNGTTFDTQLFLFKENGTGVAVNDDEVGGTSLQSTLTSQFVASLPAGDYYLVISRYDRDPQDASSNLIWASSPFRSERAPDGPGAANPISRWNGTNTAGGAYNIDLQGCEFVSAGCYADCDTSTGVNVLDIFDFLCFQNRFAASAAYACECDTSTGPGVCDIFDFLCFQNAFAAGCP